MQSTRMRAGWGALLGAIVLAGGCAALPDVRLRNPQTGKTFTCSADQGRTGGRWWDEMAKRTRDTCVKDLEAQGYVVIE